MMTIFMASVSYGQASMPSYLNFDDLNSVKRYLKDSITNLDPIEGVYSVSLKRFVEDKDLGNREKSYSYKCVIIRYGNGFYLKKITDKDGFENVYNADIYRIGETNIYDIKLQYSSGYTDNPSRKIASSRFEMSSLVSFQFKTSMSYFWPTYTYYDEFDLIKEYPTPSMYEKVVIQLEEESHPKSWTGTGYAIGNGFIVTNNHVAEGAKSISIKGIKGDMNTGYTAEVVATDKTNDIAILKITDQNFKGFGTIPYAVQQRMADVGEDVFVLGYPLTQALGNEIKLTNGIVSSRTGYQGDVSTYQMSAPVQPGNSGGPMFDSKGNVIGIVVAGVPGAENVGYAIKTSYLKILIESAGLNIKFPANNTISTLSLAEKVKRVKNFVFYIECSK